jgi:hypothetical protein
MRLLQAFPACSPNTAEAALRTGVVCVCVCVCVCVFVSLFLWLCVCAMHVICRCDCVYLYVHAAALTCNASVHGHVLCLSLSLSVYVMSVCLSLLESRSKRRHGSGSSHHRRAAGRWEGVELYGDPWSQGVARYRERSSRRFRSYAYSSQRYTCIQRGGNIIRFICGDLPAI